MTSRREFPGIDAAALAAQPEERRANPRRWPDPGKERATTGHPRGGGNG